MIYVVGVTQSQQPCKMIGGDSKILTSSIYYLAVGVGQHIPVGCIGPVVITGRGVLTCGAKLLFKYHADFLLCIYIYSILTGFDNTYAAMRQTCALPVVYPTISPMIGVKLATAFAFMSAFILVPLTIVSMDTEITGFTAVSGALLSFVEKGPVMFLIVGGLFLAAAVVAALTWVFSRLR